MRDLPVPTLRQLALRSKKAAGYTLSDMAGDAVGLLDHLGIERAHVVGASMGGMIAQTIAIEHPDRVLSLCSIMSNTGARWSGQPKLATYRVLLGTPPKDRDKFIEHVVKVYGVIGSPGFDRDEDDLRDMAGRSYDRGRNPAGSGRQLAAIIASGDRTARLRSISAPDGRRPRHEGPPRQPVRRPRDGQGDPGREARADRGHGPRPARAAPGRRSSARSPRTPPAPGSPPPSERRAASPLLKRDSVRCGSYLTNMCSHDDSSPVGRNKPLELLEREITELASHIHAATCRWLGLVAEFDRREGWARLGLPLAAPTGSRGAAGSRRWPRASTCGSRGGSSRCRSCGPRSRRAG